MFPLLAAIILAGAAGAGPVFVSDACGDDTTTNGGDVTTCVVQKISKRMRAATVPAELKVEAEGKLYSVPEGVAYKTPTSQRNGESWWEEFIRKLSEFIGKDSDAGDDADGSCRCSSDNNGKVKTSSEKDVRSSGEHSCQICFDNDHSTVMLPCGHGGLCWDCGLQIYALTEECPMCRTKIDLLVQVDGEKRRCQGEDEYVSAVCA